MAPFNQAECTDRLLTIHMCADLPCDLSCACGPAKVLGHSGNSLGSRAERVVGSPIGEKALNVSSLTWALRLCPVLAPVLPSSALRLDTPLDADSVLDTELTNRTMMT